MTVGRFYGRVIGFNLIDYGEKQRFNHRSGSLGMFPAEWHCRLSHYSTLQEYGKTLQEYGKTLQEYGKIIILS